MKVRIQRTASWDWAEVWVDGKLFYEGHSVPDHIFIQLLQKVGVEVIEHEVPDEE